MYPYIPKQTNHKEWVERRLESEYEKVIASKKIGDDVAEICWTWDWKPFTGEEMHYGAYYVGVGKFYFIAKVNGRIVDTSDDINGLIVLFKGTCMYCLREKHIDQLQRYGHGLICFPIGRPYEKCPE
jgi:hypothetical protein